MKTRACLSNILWMIKAPFTSEIDLLSYCATLSNRRFLFQIPLMWSNELRSYVHGQYLNIVTFGSYRYEAVISVKWVRLKSHSDSSFRLDMFWRIFFRKKRCGSFWWIGFSHLNIILSIRSRKLFLLRDSILSW